MENKAKIRILKKSIIFILSILITVWLTTLLTPLFDNLNKLILHKSGNYISNIYLFILSMLAYKIPIQSIFLFLFFVYVIYKILFKIKIFRSNLKILQANYGSEDVFVDITKQLNELVNNNKLSIILSNGIYGNDPLPGKVKVAQIKYSYAGSIKNKKFNEGQEITLP